MKRREFIILLGGVTAWPLAARAQQTDRVRRIGVLHPGNADDSLTQKRMSIFRSTLASLGWEEGRNIAFDHRYGALGPQNAELAARDLLQSGPDAILVSTTPATLELQRQTSTIPIVFVQATDPLASGLIKNMAHPGGNITGFSNVEFSVGGKWLGLLREVAPDIKRVMVIMAPNNPGNEGELKVIEEAGVRLGVEVVPSRDPDRDTIASALDTFGIEQNGGLIALTATQATENRDLIVERANRYRLPAIFPIRAYADEGGLMSYGIRDADIFQNAAGYMDRILRGEKPGDLPVEYSSTYEFVINNRTAKAIGLTIPESFLLLADEVIE